MNLQKAKKFIDDAQLLLDNKRFDSAASRCYYALYRLGVYLLEKEGHIRPKWNHGRMQTLIDKKGIEINNIPLYDLLVDAYGLRIKADYDKEFVSEEECLQFVNKAQSLLKEVN